MSGSSGNYPSDFGVAGGSLRQRLEAQVRAEPRKAGVLVALALVMGMTAWRLFLRSPGPSEASARAVGAASGPAGLARGETASRPLSAASAQQLREWVSKPLVLSERNLFAVNLDYFKRDDASLPTVSDAHEGFWETLEKSLAARADQEKARSILADNVRRLASKLELQSTVVVNGAPKALVNGTLLEEGETIEGFRLIRIEARKIVVEREGIRLEVSFKL
jgi:hypothetical protein